MASKKSVFGIYPNYNAAERAVLALQNEGFRNTDISVLLPANVGSKDFAHEKGTKAPEGATTGAGTGAVLGGVLGWLVGIGSLAIPGLGPFIAAGPILAALSGVAAGGTVGGITGALVGMGIPEYEAKRYEGKIRGGNILISVHAESSDEVSRAKQIFKDADAEDISYTGEESVSDEARAETLSEPSARPLTQPYNAEPYNSYISYDPVFHEDFASTYGQTGQPYTYYEPAYRYGYMLA